MLPAMLGGDVGRFGDALGGDVDEGQHLGSGPVEMTLPRVYCTWMILHQAQVQTGLHQKGLGRTGRDLIGRLGPFHVPNPSSR